MTQDRIQLPLVEAEGSGCACCSSEASAAAREAAPGAVETVYGVAGMTCGHCVSSVSEEISALPGVTGVDVDLQVGGVSKVTVRSAGELQQDAVAAAVDEAGYRLVA